MALGQFHHAGVSRLAGRCGPGRRAVRASWRAVSARWRHLYRAARSLSRARELMWVGVGILGQGHTPQSGSALASWSVLPMGCARTRGRPKADRFLRAVSGVQSEGSYRPCMRALPGPGGGQAFLPQEPHTGRGGKRPGRICDEDPDPLPVGRAQPGPQGRRCGALIKEVPHEDTGDTRGAGRTGVLPAPLRPPAPIHSIQP